MPTVRGTIAPITTKRFSVAATIDGWEVIDTDGRPVTEHFDREDIAHAAKNQLNVAALHGPKSLALALGCLDEDELAIDAMMEA